jgi:hypothetical protein
MPLLEPKHLKHTSQVNSAILPGDLLGEVLYDYHGSPAFPLWGRNIANLGWLMVAHEVIMRRKMDRAGGATISKKNPCGWPVSANSYIFF